MPRFVILKHDVPSDSDRSNHFDLMLECEGVLLTWALEQVPQDGHSQFARRLPDHRLKYLDHEGEIAGGRGFVWQVDVGSCSMQRNDADQVVATITGDTYQGQIELAQISEERWKLKFTSADSKEPG